MVSEPLVCRQASGAQQPRHDRPARAHCEAAANNVGRSFDTDFDAEIRKAAIDLWVMSDEGARHCAFVDVDHAVAQRATPYPYGAAVRACPAKEITVFRIREDADRLINIVERVILKHFGLIP